ncbi:glycosyltransferase family 2 protein [Mucisphaera calidilacus]|uniref:Undecaprenyl-phosphate 4-deoxy-4-formamido-L-arabinose transferase n=1 Tax=Mucisphaera calidilacus TaxID=2527982 RepID=A0A518BZN4_9BACT|nr:glycosyltransferase family 2 protein [Mucisphaera calidilacus]QDU72437.1 Undecaprenyl-phosphate 4-deoxy-4-formamido-L-arabinose transferase [Mucisphaera calidilacus]
MSVIPELSIVIPALDEEGNVGPLIDEVASRVRDEGVEAELIIVDDGSSDRTLAVLRERQATTPWLRVLHRDEPRGQSAAMAAGIAAARGAYVATLDADLQNDPGDLPVMLRKAKEENIDLVQGDRSANRQDHAIRRWSSAVGRYARGLLVGDHTRDTGCSARVMRAAYAKQIPLQYRGMHRFIPATVRLLGGTIAEVRVSHRARHSGTTKYGLGLLNRGFAGFFDCLAVRWMSNRVRDTSVEEVRAEGEGA